MNKQKLNIIKMGGTLLEEKSFAKLSKELAKSIQKQPSIVVHGGGKAVTALADKLGIQTRFVNGRRFTDPETMRVAEMVLSGTINPFVASSLRAHGVQAIGLSGHHSGLVQARAIAHLGRVGKVNFVDEKRIFDLLKLNYCPIFSSICQDKKGSALNVNADDMACDMSLALRAHKLILFTDVPGILDAQKKTIASITPAQGKKLIAEGVITGGMIPKVESAFLALSGGVHEIWILQPAAHLANSRGTVICKNPKTVKNPFQ